MSRRPLTTLERMAAFIVYCATLSDDAVEEGDPATYHRVRNRARRLRRKAVELAERSGGTPDPAGR